MEKKAKPTKNQSNQRAERGKGGRFLPGKAPKSPGRPPGKLSFLTELREEMGNGQWRKVVRAMLAKAQAGDGKAALFLAKYVIPNAAPMPWGLTGELRDQLMQLKVALAAGETDGRTAGVLARIVALESVLGKTDDDGKVLSIADINKILNTEVEV